MSSVTGSRLAFFSNQQINLVLTATGASDLNGNSLQGDTVAGAFNIEVFTSVAGGLAANYQGSAFIQGAVTVSGNEVLAAAATSPEQILQGSYTLLDETGNETAISFIGAGGTGGDSATVIGSVGDQITGSTNAGNTQLFDASGANTAITAGPETITGGAGNTTVWAGTGDSITGNTVSGAITVAGNAANNMTITGGAGDVAAFNLGSNNSITGSSAGTTFIDDAYGGTTGGNTNTIVGGSGTGPVVNPLGGSDATDGGAGTWINTGTADTITDGTGTTFINAVSGGGNTITGGAGATTIWGGSNNSITGGTGGTQYNSGSGSTVSGGSGNLLAYNIGTHNSIGGGAAGTTSFIDDSYVNVTLPGAFTGGHNTLFGGSGATTIIAGPSDSIIGGTGTLDAAFKSSLDSNDTVNLSSAAGRGAATIGDQSAGGTGTNVTVSNFNTSGDVIQTPDNSATLLASETTYGGAGGGTVLHFADGSTMTIIGVTTLAGTNFTH